MIPARRSVQIDMRWAPQGFDVAPHWTLATVLRQVVRLNRSWASQENWAR